jgi:hypothetical protein
VARQVGQLHGSVWVTSDPGWLASRCPLYMEVDGLRGILVAYLAGSTVVHQDPYPRLDLAESVDVGISEHTAKVCDAS